MDSERPGGYAFVLKQNGRHSVAGGVTERGEATHFFLFRRAVVSGTSGLFFPFCTGV